MEFYKLFNIHNSLAIKILKINKMVCIYNNKRIRVCSVIFKASLKHLFNSYIRIAIAVKSVQ